MSARAAILDAASQIARELGPLGLSVDKIVGRAGVSKGSFFFHFDTKEAMISALLEEVADAFGHQIEEMVADGTAFHRALIAATIDEIARNNRLLAIFVAAVAIDRTLARYVAARAAKWHQRMLDEGLTDLQARALRTMLDGMLLSNLLREELPSTDDLFELGRLAEAAMDAAKLEVHGSV
jgi:AcrR family transcriptional regulator